MKKLLLLLFAIALLSLEVNWKKTKVSEHISLELPGEPANSIIDGVRLLTVESNYGIISVTQAETMKNSHGKKLRVMNKKDLEECYDGALIGLKSKMPPGTRFHTSEFNIGRYKLLRINFNTSMGLQTMPAEVAVLYIDGSLYSFNYMNKLPTDDYLKRDKERFFNSIQINGDFADKNQIDGSVLDKVDSREFIGMIIVISLIVIIIIVAIIYSKRKRRK